MSLNYYRLRVNKKQKRDILSQLAVHDLPSSNCEISCSPNSTPRSTSIDHQSSVITDNGLATKPSCHDDQINEVPGCNSQTCNQAHDISDTYSRDNDDDDDALINNGSENLFSPSSDTSVESSSSSNLMIKTALTNWALTHNVSHSCLSDLLRIFNQFHSQDQLPLDARSLLSTPRSMNIQTVEGRQFCYYGIEKGLQSLFYIVLTI